MMGMSGISLGSMTKLERIGKGSYGEVFKARLHSTGGIVVVKEVSLVGISKEEEREILNESKVMLQVEHKNIIRFVASFVENSTLHIVMDLASGGDLAALVKANAARGVQVEEETLWTYLIELTEGLQHLHSRRILHRDIKASNIFIDADGKLKIGDLGLGKILTGTAQCALSKVGTPLYFSPEICEGKPYDTKSDMWALGCLMHELATTRPPFHAQNQIALAKKIVNDQPDMRVPSTYSKELQFIIGKMLEKSPRKRPSPESLLSYSAVQIRAERSKFRELEKELVATIESERRRGENAAQAVSELQGKMDMLVKSHEAERRIDSIGFDTLKDKVTQLQHRCEVLEADKAELTQQIRNQEEMLNANRIKSEELEKWENDLASRELKILHSEADRQDQEEGDCKISARRGEARHQRADIYRRSVECSPFVLVQTPLEPKKKIESSTTPPAPTPTNLFPTPAGTSCDASNLLNCTPLRLSAVSFASGTSGNPRLPGTPILDGYIRARARTPQTCLGPPKRVLSQDEEGVDGDADGGTGPEMASQDGEPGYLDVTHRMCGSHFDKHEAADTSPGYYSDAKSSRPDSCQRSAMTPITNSYNIHASRSAQKGIVTETGERLLSTSAAKTRHKALSDQDKGYDGCIPEVEYILAYTDRMRQAAQEAIESCATSSSGESSGGSERRAAQQRTSAGYHKEDEASKPRRKLFFATNSGGMAS